MVGTVSILLPGVEALSFFLILYSSLVDYQGSRFMICSIV